jgi:uncharacterized protein YndB with AHSA1/START domain
MAAFSSGGPIRIPSAGRAYDDAMTHTDTYSRVIAAPPERVFDAFLDQAALTAWLLPPGDMHGRFERFDARPGGVDIRADDVPDGISADDHAAGLSSSLAQLAAYLEK